MNHSKSAPTNAVISDPAPSTRIAAPHPSPTLPSPTPIKHTSHLTKLASKPSSSNLFQTTSPIPRPSLKRSRYSPTLSHPLTSNQNQNQHPFSNANSLSDPSLFQPPNHSLLKLSLNPFSPLLLNFYVPNSDDSSAHLEDPQSQV